MSELQPKKSSDRDFYLLAFRIIGDFGATIAVPVVLFALLGKYLDQKYHTTPWLTIAGFALAALVTTRMIYKKAKKYGKEYEEMDKKNKEDKK